MTGYAQQERRLLADLFDQVGPQAPTLCDGWQTADLAAHLVVREHRPDAAAGMVIRGLASYSERVQHSVRDNPDWPALVNKIRTGPPLLMRALDEAINTAEYFVHHEDVRRAKPGFTVRALEPGLQKALWTRLSSPFGRLLARRSPVGISLEAAGFGTRNLKKGSDHVTISGSPAELTLFVFGRRDVARVELDGDEMAVARLRRAHLGL
ncbi:MAG: TIGR03085 family metal-binding protein [Actinomycetota bacterium]|nr:TIGR03085 family metal-binding protein [Actinomycetota bacterium]